MRPGEPERSVVLGDPATLGSLGIAPESLIPFEVGIEETVTWYGENRAFLGLE
jgi:dTDP-D-glucose 4,6-dehydratase